MMLQDNASKAVLKRIRVSPQTLNLMAAMILIVFMLKNFLLEVA